MHTIQLLGTLLLPALALASPTPQAGGSCSTAAESSFTWNVQDLDYHSSIIFTSPAHQNDNAFVSFGFTNTALAGVQYECSAESSRIPTFFYGDMWYKCTQPDGGANGEAHFMYNEQSGVLTLNQTWSCVNGAGGSAYDFAAYGTVAVTPKCDETYTTNPDWKDGETYSDREVKCDPINLSFKPSSISASP